MIKPNWVNGHEYAVAYCTGSEFSSLNSQKNDKEYEEVNVKGGQHNEKYNRLVTTPDEADSLKALREEYEAKLQKIKLENEALHDKNETLETKYEKQRKKNKDLENRSISITKAMSELSSTKGSFENVNEEVNNTRLAQKFECLYSQKWVLLVKWMGKNCQSMSELERISYMTNAMKDGYKECEILAEKKLCDLLHTGNIQDIPADEDLSSAKILIKKIASKDSVKQRIVQDISAILMQSEDAGTLCDGNNYDTAKNKLQTFLSGYIECCWLMTLSVPTMVLDFDVVGKPFTDCDDHFKMYSTKKPVEDLTKIEGTICEVVWPCVQLQDGSAIYMKGDVIVVKKGKEAE